MIVVCIVFAYLCCQYYFAWTWLTETVATIIAIISAVAFWLEYAEGKLLNEVSFVMDLNQQFISDDKMLKIEWELDKFFSLYQSKELTPEYIDDFKNKFDIQCEERQYLVNYLVHLEDNATLIKNKFVHIDTITDLMSYHYFIAMNNPIVQELELCQYPDFYRGCYYIYDEWIKTLEKQNIKVPMIEKYRLPYLENVKQKIQ